MGDFCVPSGTMAACYSPAIATDQPVLMAAGITGPDGGVIGDGSVALGDGSGADSTTEGGGDATVEGGPGVTPDAQGDGPVGTDATNAHDASDAGMAVNTCPNPETQFGAIGVGDSNPNFTMGVGARTATQMLTFSSYSATPDAGDGGMVNSIWVQAFDPVSGASAGPAQSLLDTGLTGAVYVTSAAVAPTGQIALLYTSAGSGFAAGANGGAAYGLWAVFLDASADGGPAGLRVVTTFQLQVDQYQLEAIPSAIWSTLSQAFVFSWRHAPNHDIRIAKFLVNGHTASGGTDSVTTTNANNSVYNEGHVGAAGNLFGVHYNATENIWPYLTVLDPSGNVVGSPVALANNQTGSNHWTALGGTRQGFVAFFDSPAGGVSEVFVPLLADGGGVALPSDAGDAGTLPGFNFSGSQSARFAFAVNDDTGGAGGVGLALIFLDHVAFAYVNADGLTHVNPTLVFSHAYSAAGSEHWGTTLDMLGLTNIGGSFAVSLYSAAEQRTRIAASGCTQ